MIHAQTYEFMVFWIDSILSHGRLIIVGEAIYIVFFVAIGGYFARLAKSHPLYKHKTNKLKEKYFSHLYPNMAQKYDETEAYWLCRAISDYIFDFDRRLYVDHHVEKYRSHVESEKENLYQYHVEPANKLCEELVKRAVELNVPKQLFMVHMRELWKHDIVPVGRLTPKTILSIQGSDKYYQELINIPTSKAEVFKFMETHQGEN